MATTAPSIHGDAELDLNNDNELVRAFFQEAAWSYARGCGKHPVKAMGIQAKDMATTQVHNSQKFLTNVLAQ